MEITRGRYRRAGRHLDKDPLWLAPYTRIALIGRGARRWRWWLFGAGAHAEFIGCIHTARRQRCATGNLCIVDNIDPVWGANMAILYIKVKMVISPWNQRYIRTLLAVPCHRNLGAS